MSFQLPFTPLPETKSLRKLARKKAGRSEVQAAVNALVHEGVPAERMGKSLKRAGFHPEQIKDLLDAGYPPVDPARI